MLSLTTDYYLLDCGLLWSVVCGVWCMECGVYRVSSHELFVGPRPLVSVVQRPHTVVVLATPEQTILRLTN